MSEYRITTYLSHGQKEHNIGYEDSNRVQTYRDVVDMFVRQVHNVGQPEPDRIGCLHITGLQDIKLEEYKNILRTHPVEKATVGYYIAGVYNNISKEGRLSIYVRGLGFSYLDTKCAGRPIVAYTMSVKHKGKIKWYMLYKVFEGKAVRGLTYYEELSAKDIIKSLWLNS